MAAAQINAADLSARAIGLLEKLVAFDTTSRNSNLELIGFVEGLLGDLGVASRRVENADGRKSNLYATLGPALALPAWAYVTLRVVHSLFQATVNVIQVRFGLFFLGSLVLVAMIVRAAMLVL